MRLLRSSKLSFTLLLAFAGVACAQEVVVPSENVSLDYATVLDVEPVYQTLRASRTEQQCDQVTVTPQPLPEEEPSRWAQLLASVKGVFTGGGDKPAADPVEAAGSLTLNCRMIPVEREFRRPIAYDVDYVYKGTKYRSRMAEDPGNRLRIRVSVTPYMAELAVDTP